MATMPEIKVVIEQAVHTALARSMQHISAEHGIQVTRVSVEWMDVSTVGEPTFLVRQINIDSFSQPSDK